MTKDQRVGRLLLIVAMSAAWFGTACTTQTLHFPGDGAVLTVDDCPFDRGWLAESSPTNLTAPPPHPASECAFYQASLRYFLTATLPGTGQVPALARYATIDDLFTASPPLAPGVLAAPGEQRGTPSRAWLGNVKQPGSPAAILIDQGGHAVYYGIHLDDGFAAFVSNQGLQSAAAIRTVDPTLAFTAGVATFRSAWMDVDPADGVTSDFSRFVTTVAWVSTLHTDPATGTISEDKDHPRQIRVALLALEVAFSLPGHPELIWATFQHVGPDGSPDVAPSFVTENPADPGQPQSPTVSAASEWLYHGGTPVDMANRPYRDVDLTLDEGAQTFAQQTSVYRMFPASRSNTVMEDQEVTSLNAHFADEVSRGGADPRGGYRLMGAIWLDKPATFGLDRDLQNDLTSPFVTGEHLDQDGNLAPPVLAQPFTESLRLDGTDSVYSILGGQDRLSNPAVESFTQSPGNFNNCFTCHNTQAISPGGLPAMRDPSGLTLLPPRLLNVSRVFSQFLVDACGPTGVCPGS